MTPRKRPAQARKSLAKKPSKAARPSSRKPAKARKWSVRKPLRARRLWLRKQARAQRPSAKRLSPERKRLARQSSTPSPLNFISTEDFLTSEGQSSESAALLMFDLHHERSIKLHSTAQAISRAVGLMLYLKQTNRRCWHFIACDVETDQLIRYQRRICYGRHYTLHDHLPLLRSDADG